MKSKKKMKRKRMKKGMLLAELYRLFTVRRLMTGIFLVAIIAVISVSDLISIDSINWPAELKQSICDQLQMTLVFDRYKSLYVIAASICTVTTFPSDIFRVTLAGVSVLLPRRRWAGLRRMLYSLPALRNTIST